MKNKRLLFIVYLGFVVCIYPINKARLADLYSRLRFKMAIGERLYQNFIGSIEKYKDEMSLYIQALSEGAKPVRPIFNMNKVLRAKKDLLYWGKLINNKEELGNILLKIDQFLTSVSKSEMDMLNKIVKVSPLGYRAMKNTVTANVNQAFITSLLPESMHKDYYNHYYEFLGVSSEVGKSMTQEEVQDLIKARKELLGYDLITEQIEVMGGYLNQEQTKEAEQGHIMEQRRRLENIERTFRQLHETFGADKEGYDKFLEGEDVFEQYTQKRQAVFDRAISEIEFFTHTVLGLVESVSSQLQKIRG